MAKNSEPEHIDLRPSMGVELLAAALMTGIGLSILFGLALVIGVVWTVLEGLI